MSDQQPKFSVLPVGTMGFQVIKTVGVDSRIYCEVSVRWSLEGTDAEQIAEARDRAIYLALALHEATNE